MGETELRPLVDHTRGEPMPPQRWHAFLRVPEGMDQPPPKEVEDIRLPEVISHARVDDSETLISKYIEEYRDKVEARLSQLGISLEDLGFTVEGLVDGLRKCRRPDKRLTVEKAVEALRDFKSAVITSRANHSIDKHTWEKFSHDDPEQNKRNILFCSAVALLRKLAIEASVYKDKFLAGVEVDVLDKTGKLDLTDEVLFQLDMVVAVLHPDEFEAYGGFDNTISTRRIEADKSKEWPFSTINERVTWLRDLDPRNHPRRAAELIATAYENVAQNPCVDVLAHIIDIKMVPPEVFYEIPVERWGRIFSLMKKNNQALGISLRKVDLPILSLSEAERQERGISDEAYKKALYYVNLLKKAKEYELSFSLGIDMEKIPPPEQMRLQLFHLNQLGITEEDIIETSAEGLRRFVKERREKIGREESRREEKVQKIDL